MAGYIFSLDSLDSLTLYISNGVYATKLSAPSGLWKTHHEATFADYATMKAGDNIYFFIKRKIYGIGELIQIKKDCKFSNFPGACIPEKYNYEEKKGILLWDEAEHSIDQRWLCIFKPSPYFFTSGIDMDDVLSSNPSAFRTLRAFWKVSFIKFDDEENQAFKNVLLKFNQDALLKPKENENIFKSDFTKTHDVLSKKLGSKNYGLDISPILSTCANENHLRHEMAIEAGILYQLSYQEPNTEDVFGHWDYLSHQVIASPFKPIDYMDKMDLFGYSYITGFDPTKSRYLVAEIKKDSATNEDVEQLLKYVDWVKDEYCFGDYSMINAFLIAFDFDNVAMKHKKEVCVRKYIVGRRPAMSYEWNNLKLVKYSFNQASGKIDFAIVDGNARS